MWAGKTVCCIASGPSLTIEDCQYVKNLNIPTIAVNNSWELARFANVIYACDQSWWLNNYSKIDVEAEKWTCFENVAKQFKINCHGPFLSAQNSGMRALQFAIEKGASRVILLGYDCSLKNGIHFHGKHEKTKNPDQAKIEKWQNHFLKLDKKNCKVINCSRYTDLKAFHLAKLEDVLI